MAGTLKNGAQPDPAKGAEATLDGQTEWDAHGIVGRVIDDRYHVERAVGRGGFGVVYLARHVHFGSPVALKVMRIPALLEGEARATFVERFLAEGRLLFELSALHPAIVRVFEAALLTAKDGRVVPYLALEWLEGESLDATLERRRHRHAADLSELLSLLGPIASALGAAHTRRVAHRDVKPANIFLSQTGGVLTPKLLDFGLAKAMGDGATTSRMFADSGFEERAFTPAYAAPEQWLRRLGATGPWTDVYSFALVCVELLTAKRAIEGDDAGQLMASCLDAERRPTPQALGVPLPARAEAVFARALALQPRARYRDVPSFWSALESAAGATLPRPAPERWTGRRLILACSLLAAGLSFRLRTATDAQPIRLIHARQEAFRARPQTLPLRESHAATENLLPSNRASSNLREGGVGKHPVRNPPRRLPTQVRPAFKAEGVGSVAVRPADVEADPSVAPPGDIAPIAGPPSRQEEMLHHAELTRRN